MKLAIFLLTLFAVPAVAESTDCAHGTEELRCVTYVRNYDADTITVNVPNIHPLLGHEISVRLKGVDTPEIRTKDVCEKKVGLEAKMFVTGILESAKRIDLVSLERDKYFRILADVVVDGTSISSQLLAQGFAYPYYGGTKQKIDWCAYRRARSQGE